MTDAQIAELERTVLAGHYIKGGPVEEIAPLLPRLLEERRRLLDVVRGAAAAIGDEGGYIEDIRAAIAYAEEPWPK